jgi:hypothetical protein
MRSVTAAESLNRGESGIQVTALSRAGRCALSTDSAHNAARRGGESGIQVTALSRAGRCALNPAFSSVT